MKKDLFITDADDTALDFAGRVREFYNNEYGGNVIGKSKSWSLCDWLGVRRHEQGDILDKFMSSSDFGILEPLAGAKPVLSSMNSNGIKIIVVTACGDDPIRQALRRANLRNVFNHDVSDVIFVGQDQSKYDVIKSLTEEYNVIGFADDKWANIEDGLKLDIPCYLYKQPHNLRFRDKAKESGVESVHDWYEIKYHTQEVLGKKWKV